MKSIYCTIASKTRVYQSIVLYWSLCEFIDPAELSFHVLCADPESYGVFRKLDIENIIVLQDAELAYENISELKSQRKSYEYCWTLKPLIIDTLIHKYPQIDRVTYLDADLVFYADIRDIIEKQPCCSVLLTREEKYNTALSDKQLERLIEITGKYNSGFISFKNDSIGHKCLKWWGNRCIKVCSIDVSKGYFGDQKYLDEMSSNFLGVCDVSTSGVNVGPWNRSKYVFKRKINGVSMGACDLIFYHFSGLRILNKNEIEMTYDLESEKYIGHPLPFIYEDYKKMIHKAILFVERIDAAFNGFSQYELEDVKKDLKDLQPDKL
ncbi:glycosyltransferase [Bacillus thuringiensis]|uniref:glycosyltransferase n=1 Tax=Bacillus thuringiensis TaxID=1428 RepID=UPI000E4DEC34|nr:glycosyltransferase [Bacillus thuringiensis]MDZ3952412.1 glycosyltransferase [Bacillus thuringiensis]RGP45232.1 hypothetical protein BTW32_26075 [Bacillus thuringiensis]